MNLPNKLSFLRVLLIPVIVLFYYFPSLGFSDNELGYYLLSVIFIVASLTDFLDGYLARKMNLVTTFGKFIDPLADKLLVLAALLILNDAGIIRIWITVIILSREFIVTGIRLIAVGEGNVIAASKLGKYKTASTMIVLIMLLALPYLPYEGFKVAGEIVLYIGTALTVISGIDYFIKNKEIITSSI